MNEPGADHEAAFGRLADEFLERLTRGEDPAMEPYAAAHPELADLIRDGFPLLRAVRTQARPADPPPAKFGEFRIVRLVGRGGMGVVYEAVQESLSRRVALKVLSAARAAEPATVERFRREARTAGGLHHTNIVPVIAVGDHDGIPYYAMQFIDGRPLDRVLRDARASGRTESLPQCAETETDACADRSGASSTTAPLSAPGSGEDHFRTVARIGADVADALAYAHRQGVLHRDVKPANLLLDTHGTVWVTDFGLAKDNSSQDLTRTGEVVGTLRYLAPERTRGEADARSDVYALGVTLYELATGRAAFDASDPAELLKQIMAGRKPAPRAVDPRVPRDLETIILRAMATEPGDRYRSAADLADDLRRFVSDRPVAARRLSAVELGWRWARRNPTVASLVAAVALLLVASAGGAWWAVFHLRAENARAVAAERDALERLIQSRGDQARAALASRRPGQRHDSLAAIAEAARAARDLGTFDRDAKSLRALAIAALSLPDARPVAAGPAADPAAVTLAVDAHVGLYVSGDARGMLRIGRVADGQALRTIPGPGRYAYDLLFGPRGAFLAAQYNGHYDLRLWAVAGAPDYTAPINGELSFSPDERLAAVPDPARGIILYDLEASRAAAALRPAGVLPLRPGRHVCAFDPAGERLLVTSQGDRNGFDLFDLRTRAIVQSAELPSAPGHVAWDSTGRYLAANVEDGIRVWDTRPGRWHARLTGVTKWVAGLTFTADGLVAAVDDQFHLWDPETGRLALELGGQQMKLVESPAGEATAVRRVGERLEVWEVTRSPVCRSWGFPEARLNVESIAWVAGGRLLAVATSDGVDLYDLSTGRRAGRLAEGPVDVVATCPRDGSVLTVGPAGARRYAVSAGGAGGVTFSAAEPVDRLTPQGPVRGGAFSPDGSAVAFALRKKEGAVLLADWPVGRTRTLPGPLPWAASVALSPDGRWVAGSTTQTLPAPHRLLVWDARTGELAKRFNDAEMPHSAALAFSPDGRWLVAGTPFEYRFFEVGSWSPGPRLPASSWPGESPVAFGPGGLLAVAQDRTSVGLRSADTLEEIATLPSPGDGWIWQFTFSPDGRSLAVVCDKGVVHVWDLARLRADLAGLGLDWDTPVARPVSSR
jgi:serine/threonine protein kinase/WD40 repeat protein